MVIGLTDLCFYVVLVVIQSLFISFMVLFEFDLVIVSVMTCRNCGDRFPEYLREAQNNLAGPFERHTNIPA